MHSRPSWLAAPLLLCCLATLTPSSLLSQPLALSERQQTWQEAVNVQRERSQRFLAVEQSSANESSAITATLAPLALTFATLPHPALIGAGVGTGYMLAVWAWEYRYPPEPSYGPRWDPRGRRDEAIR